MTQHFRRATYAAAYALLAVLGAPCHTQAQRLPAARVTNASLITPPAHATPREVRAARTARTARIADTMAFAHAALRESRTELVPALEQMASSNRDHLVARPMVTGAAAELRAKRSRSSALQLLDRTAASLEAMCTDADGHRARACRSLAIDLTAARAHARAGRRPQARLALVALARHADEAVRAGAFVSWEGTVIAETARYATERV
jgi:hypothetical protein